MEYLDESGLQQFLSNLYNSIQSIQSSIDTNNNQPEIDYTVTIDGETMNGNFSLVTYGENNNLYIVKNI